MPLSCFVDSRDCISQDAYSFEEMVLDDFLNGSAKERCLDVRFAAFT